MFYIKVKDLKERTDLLEYLKAHGIHAVFHYVYGIKPEEIEVVINAVKEFYA